MEIYTVTRETLSFDDEDLESQVIGVYSSKKDALDAIDKYKELNNIIMDDFVVEKFILDNTAGRSEDSCIV